MGNAGRKCLIRILFDLLLLKLEEHLLDLLGCVVGVASAVAHTTDIISGFPLHISLPMRLSFIMTSLLSLTRFLLITICYLDHSEVSRGRCRKVLLVLIL